MSIMNPGAVAFSRLVTAAVLVALFSAAAGDDQFTKDKQECAPQLVVLSPCLSYVGGNAKAPTMDCCSSLKQVLTASKKCLCLLIKYRNEADLGVKIDANLALGLPAVCHATSDISNCPALLHLAPNSPDAKVFTDFAKGHNSTSTTSTASAPVTVTPASTSSDSKASDGGPSKRRLGALAVFYGIVLLAFFLTLS
ncbi:hypothetical protein V2J09_001006 [Rumex salicifolius]